MSNRFWKADSKRATTMKAVVASNGHIIARNYTSKDTAPSDVGLHLRIDHRDDANDPRGVGMSSAQKEAAGDALESMYRAAREELGFDMSDDLPRDTVVMVESGAQAAFPAILIASSDHAFTVRVLGSQTGAWEIARYGTARYSFQQEADLRGETGYFRALINHGRLWERLIPAITDQDILKYAFTRSSTKAIKIACAARITDVAFLRGELAQVTQETDSELIIAILAAMPIDYVEQDVYMTVLLDRGWERTETDLFLDHLDQDHLLKVVLTHPKKMARVHAAKRLTDQAMIESIGRTHWCKETACAVLVNIEDEAYLWEESCRNKWMGSPDAFEIVQRSIHDREHLMWLWENGGHTVMRAALAKMNDLAFARAQMKMCDQRKLANMAPYIMDHVSQPEIVQMAMTESIGSRFDVLLNMITNPTDLLSVMISRITDPETSRFCVYDRMREMELDGFILTDALNQLRKLEQEVNGKEIERRITVMLMTIESARSQLTR